MKTLVAVAVALALAASAHVASAYVAVVGTVISIPECAGCRAVGPPRGGHLGGDP